MISAGIIAEYNPFHLGHQYHIEQTRNQTGAQCIVVIMSGDFVQRGEPAVMNKFLRTKCALSAGADLVIEMPVVSALSSAENFAYTGVKLLDAFGVNYLSFGSEAGSLDSLSQIAQILCREPSCYKAQLQKHLSNGLSFPKSRELALLQYNTEFASVLSNPNNILGIEYLKAIFSGNFKIQPVSIPRKGADYHSIHTKSGAFPSATALRNHLLNGNFDGIKEFIPESVATLLKSEYQHTFPVFTDDFSNLLFYRLSLLCESGQNLTEFSDVSAALANRINKYMSNHLQPISFSQMAMELKTKEITYSRIMRSLMHILLNHTCAENTDYIRILGFNRIGQEFLSKAKKNVTLPIITKPATAKEMIKKDSFASGIYRQIVHQNYGTVLPDDFTYGVIRWDLNS